MRTRTGASTSSHAGSPLVEETKDLAGNVLSPGLLVVHNTSGSRENDVTELTRRQELHNPLLHVAELDVVAGTDNTGLVEAVDLSANRSRDMKQSRLTGRSAG